MIGQLHEHPLAELLQEISETRLSGALRLEQERLKTVVYLADGEPIYVTSNLRLHRLAECASRWQALSAEQLAQLPASLSDLEFAAALLKEQLLSREQLDALQARQAAEMLRPALLWTEGTWEFDARVRIAQAMRVSVQMKRLLLEGARRLPPDFTAARISDLNEKLSPPMSAPEANLELLPKEAFVLSRLDAPLTVAELLSISTLSEEETRHIVYTLALGGLVTRERPSRAFSAQMLERARSVKAPSQSATPAPKQEQAPARSKSAPADVAAPAGVKAEAVEEFGLDAFFARLERATTHYEALGVRRSAPPAEIKSSYHKLAKSFHPDRFHKDADAALRARIEAAFARVAQAYETLKEKQSRATYDLKLSQTSASVQPQQQQSASAPFGQTQTQASGSVPRQPEATEAEGAAAARSRTAAESFGRGLLALRQSKPTAAIVSFAEAARLVPTDARYRAYYGRALAENESTRRQAENELKVAIALDGSNAGYRVMLAEVYALIGLPRRAQSELERALALDSKNTAARELLNTLQAAKG